MSVPFDPNNPSHPLKEPAIARRTRPVPLGDRPTTVVFRGETFELKPLSRWQRDAQLAFGAGDYARGAELAIGVFAFARLRAIAPSPTDLEAFALHLVRALQRAYA